MDLRQTVSLRVRAAPPDLVARVVLAVRPLRLRAVSREPPGVFDRALVRLHRCCRDSMVCLVRVLLGPDARAADQDSHCACRPSHCLHRLAGQEDEMAAPPRRSVAFQGCQLCYPLRGLRCLARDRGRLASGAVRHQAESQACVLLPRSDGPSIERPAHPFLLARWGRCAPFPCSVCLLHPVHARASLPVVVENRLRVCRESLLGAPTLRGRHRDLLPATR